MPSPQEEMILATKWHSVLPLCPQAQERALLYGSRDSCAYTQGVMGLSGQIYVSYLKQDLKLITEAKGLNITLISLSY